VNARPFVVRQHGIGGGLDRGFVLVETRPGEFLGEQKRVIALLERHRFLAQQPFAAFHALEHPQRAFTVLFRSDDYTQLERFFGVDPARHTDFTDPHFVDAAYLERYNFDGHTGCLRQFGFFENGPARLVAVRIDDHPFHIPLRERRHIGLFAADVRFDVIEFEHRIDA